MLKRIFCKLYKSNNVSKVSYIKKVFSVKKGSLLYIYNVVLSICFKILLLNRALRLIKYKKGYKHLKKYFRLLKYKKKLLIRKLDILLSLNTTNSSNNLSLPKKYLYSTIKNWIFTVRKNTLSFSKISYFLRKIRKNLSKFNFFKKTIAKKEFFFGKLFKYPNLISSYLENNKYTFDYIFFSFIFYWLLLIRILRNKNHLIYKNIALNKIIYICKINSNI